MVKVSVIIPVYNAQEYLEDCLNSIFNQTLKDIEVVCVNDGSTDHSLDILAEYKKQHCNMIIFSQGNAGSGNARNKGITLAHGEYVMFADPDDFLASEDAVETLYTTAKDKNVDVCGGNMLKFEFGALSARYDGAFEKYTIKKEGMLSFKQYQFAYGHTRYLIKKDFIINNSIFYPPYKRGQDIVFLASLLNMINQFYVINKNIYVHRKGHKKETFTMEKADDLMKSLHAVLTLAVDNNLKELFEIYVKQINGVANKYWYKLIRDGKWKETLKINECIMKGNLLFGFCEKENTLLDKVSYEEKVKNAKDERNKINTILGKNEKIIIYGAGTIGRRVLKYLKLKNRIPCCFIVSDNIPKETMIDGIPVIPVTQLHESKEFLFILSAADPTVKTDMKEHLINKGYNNILNLNTDIFKFTVEME